MEAGRLDKNCRGIADESLGTTQKGWDVMTYDEACDYIHKADPLGKSLSFGFPFYKLIKSSRYDIPVEERDVIIKKAMEIKEQSKRDCCSTQKQHE
jgi:hypothetical protein